MTTYDTPPAGFEGNPPPGAQYNYTIEASSGGSTIARFTRADHYQAGDRGPAVRELNQWLIENGYLTAEDIARQGGSLEVVGTGTRNAIQRFNEEQGYEGGRDILGADALRDIRQDLKDNGYTTVNAETSAAGGRALIDDPNGWGTAASGPSGGTTSGSKGPLMSGGQLTRIDRAGQNPLWAMTYTINGIEHVYTFASEADMKATLGNNAWSSGKYGNKVLAEDSVNDGDTWLIGDADAVTGSGNYQSHFEDMVQEEALKAGSRDPTLAGRYARDPEIQRLIAIGAAAGWTPQQLKAEIRQTSFYTEELYPGIKAFYGQTSDPETAWVNYYSDVEGALEDLGYERDSNGSYAKIVGDMLDRGIDEEDFTNFAPVFVRAESDAEFASALGYWTQNNLGKALNFDDLLSVYEGTATPDIAAVVEKGILQYRADQIITGSALTPEQITRIANQTDLSESQIIGSFTSAEQALLAVGNKGLAKYGLTQEALVNAAFDLESSQGTAEAVRRLARKTAIELGVLDDPKAQFFVGYNPQGAPKRQGMQALRPEAG